MNEREKRPEEPNALGPDEVQNRTGPEPSGVPASDPENAPVSGPLGRLVEEKLPAEAGEQETEVPSEPPAPEHGRRPDYARGTPEHDDDLETG